MRTEMQIEQITSLITVVTWTVYNKTRVGGPNFRQLFEFFAFNIFIKKFIPNWKPYYFV